MRSLSKALAAAALITMAIPAAPALAAPACTASYYLTSISRTGQFTATVVVANIGDAPTKAWAVSWIYRDVQRVTSVSNAVPLPVIGIPGAHAFGNTPANGTLVPGQRLNFVITGAAATPPPTVPSPIHCQTRPS